MKASRAVGVLLCLASAACNDNAPERRSETAAQPMRVEALAATFRRLGYDLDSVRTLKRAVPRLLIAALPEDLDEIGSASDRKAMFIAFLLPAILHANAEVAGDRRAIERVRADLARGKAPADAARAHLRRIAERYGVAADDLDGMLRRVDSVPVSLALAQAAIESGWGTSRFAREGRALFGQRTYSGAGLEPGGIARSNFRVRTFDHPADSVAAYLLTLNTHPAYEPFRVLRAEMRRRGAEIDARALAATLTRYSERGREYVADVRAVMRANRLDAFDDARLDGEPRTSPI
jgi:Bax protein